MNEDISPISLIQYAKEAMLKSYSPYSKFKVGAALLTENKKIFMGCNIENISFGLTNCAERTSIYNAIVSEGAKKELIKDIAVVCSKDNFCFPCGACRQVILEFGSNARVIVQEKNNITVHSITELLAHGFNSKHLVRER